MKSTYKIILVLLLLAVGINKAAAQLNPISAQYYTNPYLANPAFAGVGNGLKLNAAYRKLWDNIPGSPETQSITADYGFKKVGVGLSMNNDRAGLQRQTRVLATYAYHLPIDEGNQELDFGISIGFMNQRIEGSDIYGNPNDVSVSNYNDRQTYLDGDFGIAYTMKKFNIQAAIPNLKNFFKKDVVKVADVATFYSAISYRFDLGLDHNEMELAPKLAYRGVKGYHNIWDLGTQLSFIGNQVLLQAMYHSTENATFGLGVNFRKKYLINALYSTQTSALSGYTNGSFELNIGINFTNN